ncbi:MAG: type transport system ATP-binding protein [Actinomycetota bacterium]|nr:type transport system ATP-binding protein [Actinomycetota bacterium]
MAAIELSDLRMTYRTRRGPVRALDGLDLSVPQGGVFGFLGANGAGKTTTIRALVGHLRRVQGSMRMLDVDIPARLNTVIDRVGALVEAPSFFPNFTGRKNLTLLAQARGFPIARVDDVLRTVDLTERSRTRFATYSLGMKQRLGVAAALLKDPELLILDEPANGLDPAGILEMRNLLRRLGHEGRTVFVSSHILPEVQQFADRIAVVHRGKCVATGTVQELLQGGRSTFRVRVPGDDREQHLAASVLQQAGFGVQTDAEGHMVVEAEQQDSPRVTKTLADAAIYLAELTPVERTLEDAFFELTKTDSEPGT